MNKYLIIGNGENTHIVKWVKALVNHYELYLISSKTTHNSIQSLLPSTRIFNLNLEVSGDGGNYKILLKYFKVKKIIQAIDPDFVNAHYITSHGFLAALVKKFTSINYTLIQSAWGSDILVTPFRNKIYHSLTKFILNQADLVTSDSSTMTEVIQSLSGSPTMTFSFGLEALPAFTIDEKEDYLFFSNRILSENYCVQEIIRFFGRIASKHETARLIISHDGEQRQMLEEQVVEMGLQGKVTFAGFVTEQEQINIYRKAQFYVSIPKSDATSVSLLEAMAYGCIPIVSDIPANHEWIKEPDNGIFYKDVETGREEVDEALKFKSSIIEKNREIIKQRAIFPDSIKEYVTFLNSINL